MRPIVILSFCALLCASCSDPISSNSTGTELPVGDLYGVTQLMISNDSIAEDQSGILVSAEGTSYSTLTDKDGNWKLAGLPTRNYNLSFSKQGYGTFRYMSYAHVGGTPSRITRTFVFKIPDCPPVFDNILDAPNYVLLYTHVPCMADSRGTNVAFYFSSTPDVSREQGKYGVTIIGRAGGGMPIEEYLTDEYFKAKGAFEQNGIDPKETVYVVAYALGGYSIYDDPITEERIYPAMNPEPSRVMSFKHKF
jgi:hypothetical protein